MLDMARNADVAKPVRHTVARRASSNCSLPIRIEPKRYGLSWEETVEIVASNDLARFHRQPTTEAAYRVHLSQVKAVYGSVQDYVLDALLQWGIVNHRAPESLKHCRRPADVIAWSGCPHSSASSCGPEVYFRGECSLSKALVTPFPYAIPSYARHQIVWCKVPILHPCAIDRTAFDPWIRDLAWQHIQLKGLTGVEIGERDDDSQGRYLGGLSEQVMSAVSSHPGAQDSIRRAIWNAGRHVRSYVQVNYGQQYDAVWFANPPSLQSIPDLAHFHCMLSPKRSPKSE